MKSGNLNFLETSMPLQTCNDVPGSLDGIATNYGLEGPGSYPGEDEIFPPFQTVLGAHPASCKMGTGSFPGVKCGRGVLLTTYHLLMSQSWKSTAIPLPTLWATPDLYRDHFTFTMKMEAAAP